MKRLFIALVIVIQFILVFAGCSTQKVSKEESITVKNQEMYDFFRENNKNCKAIYVKEADINGDSIEDMIVIFTHKDEVSNKEETAFTVVLNKGDSFKVLGHYKAPAENQKIEFKDVDNKPPMEFIISGSKKGSVGYSIYRLQNEKVVDIFGGDGMAPC